MTVDQELEKLRGQMRRMVDVLDDCAELHRAPIIKFKPAHAIHKLQSIADSVDLKSLDSTNAPRA
ncbi:MAG: hypothetical protein KAJ19_18880 [Gammaproteobacteria bacterium]|nr:hypothetical protein [Gammaproteobacteria bacterium]